MNKTFILCCVSIVACRGAQVNPVNVNSTQSIEVQQSQPHWVQKKPVVPGYYIGIGNAYLRDPEHQSNAKTEALSDLASEINVTIESTSLLSQVENDRGFYENFRAAIRSSSTQEIEAHEVVDSWNDDKQYWVYYRLSKATYDQIRKEKKQAAFQLAKGYFTSARNNESTSPILATQLYSQAIESLKDHLNESNMLNYEGSNFPIASESLVSVRRILNEIELQVSENPCVFKSGEHEKMITIQALKQNQLIKGLPLRTKLGDQVSIETTNEEGAVKRFVSRHETLKQTYLVEISLDYLQAYPFVYKLLEHHPLGKIAVNFSVPPPIFYVRSEEKNLETELPNKILEPIFSQILTEKGAQIGIQNTSEFTLSIISQTRKGAEISGLYSTYLEITISIHDQEKNVLFADSFSEIKGLHTSYEKAGIRAYQNVKEELSDQIRSSLTSNFFNKN